MVDGAAVKSNFYQIIPGDGFRVLKLIGALPPEGTADFDREVAPQLVAEPFCHLIINLDNVSGMSKAWLRSLMLVLKSLAKVNKMVRFIMVSQELKNYFMTEGVDTAFRISPNLRDAQVELGLVTKKALDVDFINPFLNATINVLRVQASTQAKPGKIYIKKEKDKFSGDISGVIGLVSESFSGSVVISFPEGTFLKLISRMLGETFTTMSKEIEDGAGELTNIIFGQAKIVLNERGYGIKTALPSVVSGKNHSVSNVSKGPVVVVPFEADVGAFFIEICISG